MASPSDGIESAPGFDYFVIRLSRSVRKPARVSGLIERLGSGEKRWFYSGEQLVQLVTLWPQLGPEEPSAPADTAAGPPSHRKESTS
ncbi:MAG: hypothetical protein ACREMX_17860 [Gemmatimonadales bacterium]